LLGWLGKRYDFVTLYELKQGLISGLNSSGSKCCLTFDDGLLDHYNNVFPELKKRNIPAHFFVSTLPYIEGRATDIHLTHALQFELGEEKFIRILQREYHNRGIMIDIYGEPLGDKYSKWSSPLLSNAKTSLKMVNPKQRTDILLNMFKEFLGDPDDFRKGMYLTFEQIQEMEQGGMFFGSHGHMHSFLKEMSTDEQEIDIRTADSFLRKILIRNPDIISYPFGSYNEMTLGICRKMGYQVGLSVHRGDNDADTPVLELRRMDIKEIMEYALTEDGRN